MQSLIEVTQSKGLKNPPEGKNYLYYEQSLYLKQHQDNPVMWYPWCREAFEAAKEQNKLIFISIGYSTCHWCHVMERESFSNPDIAKLMNEVFVSIKIDREERPDLDRIFMRICEITSGNCGWPLNLILTPDGLPIFVATYIPPETRRGLIGMKELIQNIRKLWETERERCISVGNKIISALLDVEKQILKKTSDVQISQEILIYAFESIKRLFDPEFGGFGDNMKFPNPSVLYFLLRFYSRTRNKEALDILEKTLDEMRYGGIYDHIGGGFHRYAVERTWTIPHFEKMLYDNAQLIEIYSEAYQLTKKEIYKQTVYHTIEYILENLFDKNSNLFYIAQDAESEGEEGKYYLWEYDEIKEILGENIEVFARYFGISPYGSSYILGRKNVLRISNTPDKIMRLYNLGQEEFDCLIKNSLQKLKEARSKRVAPYIDKKIAVDINSLMIKALSKASFILSDRDVLDIAKKSADSILSIFKENGWIPHVIYQDGSKINGLLDDYSFFAEALLELFFASQEIEYLLDAKLIIDHMISRFYTDGAFFNQPRNSDFVFVRQKDAFDSAVPSGNSVALSALLKIYSITNDINYLKIAESTIQTFINSVLSSPLFHSYFLSAIDLYIGQNCEIVISSKNKDDIERFLDVIRDIFLPQKMIFVLTEESRKEFSKISDFLGNFPIYERGKVCICSSYGYCRVPTDNVDDLKNTLKDFALFVR